MTAERGSDCGHGLHHLSIQAQNRKGSFRLIFVEARKEEIHAAQFLDIAGG